MPGKHFCLCLPHKTNHVLELGQEELGAFDQGHEQPVRYPAVERTTQSTSQGMGDQLAPVLPRPTDRTNATDPSPHQDSGPTTLDLTHALGVTPTSQPTQPEDVQNSARPTGKRKHDQLVPTSGAALGPTDILDPSNTTAPKPTNLAAADVTVPEAANNAAADVTAPDAADNTVAANTVLHTAANRTAAVTVPTLLPTLLLTSLFRTLPLRTLIRKHRQQDSPDLPKTRQHQPHPKDQADPDRPTLTDAWTRPTPQSPSNPATQTPSGTALRTLFVRSTGLSCSGRSPLTEITRNTLTQKTPIIQTNATNSLVSFTRSSQTHTYKNQLNLSLS
ncbi:hypothetical protein KFL_005250010 [Klebsormidium nitens]|uniref:Uncharacterized protein n=1 Tax=Klebsormidium nitens TaxID=105231 RepID=A0A1Y1IEX0_KLENI|nr:hypothetical protein KFL_005250010 [Klebsormidium nitens]|eukprot:GAQ89450.1 hypothetical protein KFL_005250010 [Klebsormidium nitens]